MRVPMSWLREHVDLLDSPAHEVAERLTEAGLKVEHVDRVGEDVSGVLVVRVEAVEELAGFKKPIRWVTVTDGVESRQVICGATNFRVGDLVAYARPPALLPGGFRVDKRTAYGRVSDGMICSARELGVGEDHSGILVLEPGTALGADVVEALALRDDVLDIAVNPDRGYALSVRGVAREVAIAYDVGFRDPADVAVPVAGTPAYDVRVEDRDGCDRYVARVVTGLDPQAPSPQWLQRRLTLAGMRPISLAVDVTNHVMLELGQPLHAFDRSRLRGAIVVRRAGTGERLRTLDDVERTLHVDDLVICDDSGPIALAGVMGGAATEIGPQTTEIVLESAHFDPIAIAYTARRHRLGSEASRRYERGVDDALAPAAAQVAVHLLAGLGGATVVERVTDVDNRSTRPVVTLDVALPGRVAGVPYDAATVRARLADVGCAVDGDDPMRVTPPSWRPDLRRPVDLVEEIVRLQGYDGLPSTVPVAPAGAGLTRSQRQRRQVGRALAAAGYAEVLSYPFTAVRDADALSLPSDDPRRPTVRLANPVSEEEPWLRATLLSGLLAALARNIGRGSADVAVFETGPVFRTRPGAAAMPRLAAGVRPADADLAAVDAALPDQPLQVAVALAGARERAGWWGPGRPAVWADAVEAARVVGRAVGVEVEVTSGDRPPWHPGRCAALLVGGAVVGHAGELHPRVVEALALPAHACAMEMALEPVLDAAPEVPPGPRVSAYPAATLDVAVVVAADVPAAAVGEALWAGAGPLLEDLRLFDVYSGDQVGPDRKSLAFSLRLRADDRTLTVDEAVAVRDSAVAEAGRRVGAVLRGA